MYAPYLAFCEDDTDVEQGGEGLEYLKNKTIKAPAVMEQDQKNQDK